MDVAMKGSAMAPNTKTQIRVPGTAVAIALESANMAPSEISPLSGNVSLQEADRQAILVTLRQNAIFDDSVRLSPQWHSAFEVLACPQQRLDVLLGSTDGLQQITYAVAGGISVSHAAQDGEHRISFPFTADDLVDACSSWLSLTVIPEMELLSADLSPSELTAVAALVDCIRERQLRDLLGRRQMPVDSFKYDDMVYQLEAGMAYPDHRWLASLLADLSPASFRPRVEHLAVGLEALARRQWVQILEGFADPVGVFPVMANGLGSTMPYVVLRTTAASGVGDWLISFRGLQMGWSIEFREAARLTAMGGGMMQDFLTSRFRGWFDSTATPRQPVAATPVIGPDAIPTPVPVVTEHPSTPSEPPPHVRTRPTTVPEVD